MNPPFLPEPEIGPIPAAPPASRWKTLVLWAVLILLFVGIWQFLTPSDKNHDGATHVRKPAVVEAKPCEESSGVGWANVVAIVFPTALVIFLLKRHTRATLVSAQFYATQERGTEALARRRFGEAAQAFRDTLPAFAKQPAARAVILHNVADALLHDGKLDEALAAYAEMERARQFPYGGSIRVQLAARAAFIHALKGDIPTAKTWTEDLRRRLAKSAEERRFQGANLALAEATILCREGAHVEAVKYLDERWLDIRFNMTADTFRTVEIVRAFAEAQAGTRGANVVAERLVRIEPVTKGELAFLGVAWPEMQAFLAAHDL